MHWIFLSPHFDDAALSGGGLVWELAHQGGLVEIWTICAGIPVAGPLSPFAHSLHLRWGITGEEAAQAVEVRRAEDIASCRVLGASYRHFAIPDCIYRMKQDGSGPICDSEESLSTCFSNEDENLACWLAGELSSAAQKDAVVAAPLSLGKHVDHCLTRKAAELSGLKLRYYADYPYVLKDSSLPNLDSPGQWAQKHYAVSEEGLEAWIESIAAHASQISTFWLGVEEMRDAIRCYRESMNGMTLWEQDSI